MAPDITDRGVTAVQQFWLQVMQLRTEDLHVLALAWDFTQSCIRSLDGTILYWCTGNERLYGFSRDEAIGRVTHTLLNTLFPAPLEEINANLLRNGEWKGELRHTTKSGSDIWVASHWKLNLPDAARLSDVVEVNNDITESRKTAESARFLAKIVECSDDAIISKDVRGIVTSWNAGAERLFGYTTDEMVGQSILRLFPSEDSEEERMLMARLLRGESIEHYETVRLTKSGRHLDVSLSISPLFDSQGKIIGAAKICRDISRRKFLERAFLESEERQRLALEAGELGLWSLDLATNVSYWNDRCKAIFGLAASAPTPTLSESLNLVHEQDRELVAATFDRCLLEGADFDMEFRLTDPAGEIRWVQSKGRPHFDARGKVAAVYGTIADLTTRKQLEESLRATNAQLEQFASVVAHDLQEPLRNIALSIGLARRVSPQPFDPKVEEFLGSAVQNATKMEQMVRSLLSYSRVLEEDAGNWPITDTNQVISVAVDNLKSSIMETSASVQSADLPPVRMRETHLLQVFQNLISNALKYHGDEAPLVYVGASSCEGYRKFWVQDNGIGIAPQYRERVFGLFKRLQEKDVPGTGVGLALCKRIVEHYGGEIWVDSDGAAGTRICFTAPSGDDRL